MNGDMTWPDDPLSGGEESVPPTEDTWSADDGLEPDYLDAEYEEPHEPEPEVGEPEPVVAGFGEAAVDAGGHEPEDLAEDRDDVAVDESDHEQVPAAEAELPQASDASPFPASLELDVQPSDGGDWVDPELLGRDGDDMDLAFADYDSPQALLADLHDLDRGEGEPSWSALAGSEDPAVRALAGLWGVPAGA